MARLIDALFAVAGLVTLMQLGRWWFDGAFGWQLHDNAAPAWLLAHYLIEAWRDRRRRMQLPPAARWRPPYGGSQ